MSILVSLLLYHIYFILSFLYYLRLFYIILLITCLIENWSPSGTLKWARHPLVVRPIYFPLPFFVTIFTSRMSVCWSMSNFPSRTKCSMFQWTTDLFNILMTAWNPYILFVFGYVQCKVAYDTRYSNIIWNILNPVSVEPLIQCLWSPIYVQCSISWKKGLVHLV
jgi:hypothetical protein